MTETGLPFIVNIMAADGLVMQGAWASAVMVLTIGQVILDYFSHQWQNWAMMPAWQKSFFSN